MEKGSCWPKVVEDVMLGCSQEYEGTRWLVVAWCGRGNQGVRAEIHQESNKGFLRTENQGFVEDEKRMSRQEEEGCERCRMAP